MKHGTLYFGLALILCFLVGCSGAPSVSDAAESVPPAVSDAPTAAPMPSPEPTPAIPMEQLAQEEMVTLLSLRQEIVQEMKRVMAQGVDDLYTYFDMGNYTMPEQPQFSQEAIRNAVSSAVGGSGVLGGALGDAAGAAATGGNGDDIVSAITDSLGQQLTDAILDAAGVNTLISAYDDLNGFADRVAAAMDTTPDYALSLTLAKATRAGEAVSAFLVIPSPSLEEVEQGISDYTALVSYSLSAINLKNDHTLVPNKETNLWEQLGQLQAIDRALALCYNLTAGQTLPQGVPPVALPQTVTQYQDCIVAADLDRNNLASSQGGANMYGVLGGSSNPLAGLFGSGVQYNIERDMARLADTLDALSVEINGTLTQVLPAAGRYYGYVGLAGSIYDPGLEGNAAALNTALVNELLEQAGISRQAAAQALPLAVARFDCQISLYRFALSASGSNTDFLSRLAEYRQIMASMTAEMEATPLSQEDAAELYHEMAASYTDLAAQLRDGAFTTVHSTIKKKSMNGHHRDFTFTTRDGTALMVYDEPVSGGGSIGLYIYESGQLRCFACNGKCIVFQADGSVTYNDYTDNAAQQIQTFAADFARDGLNISKRGYSLMYW